MRKLVFNVALASFVLTNTANAQDWQALEGKIVNNNGSPSTFTVAPNGIVYAFFANAMNGKAANVKKHDGKNWTSVGSEDFSGPADAFCIATDNNGVPYVAYRDMKRENKALVQKFNNGKWEVVGSGEISEGYVNGTSICFDNTNTPYLGFTDQKRGKVAVFKFVNGTWNEMPSPDEQTTGDYLTLAFNKQNELYVTYTDGNNGRKAIVKKFTGKSWEILGTTASDKEAKYTSLAFTQSGAPLIGFQDAFFGGKVLVRKYDAKTKKWENLGDSPFTASNDNVSLTIVKDVPYVAFHNSSTDHIVTIKKFNGTKWEDVSSPGNGGGALTSIIYTNNTLYVGFNKSDYGVVVSKESGK